MKLLRGTVVLMTLVAGLAAQPETALSFAVLGHLRGDPVGDPMRNPLLDEVIADCAAVRPDLVVLSGDSIWGDCDNVPADPAVVEREWDVLDAALAKLGVPIHRVPGNHDITDLATRDLYYRRYGRVPSAVRVNGVLLLLLSTTWIPADGDTSQARQPHGVPLDQAQLDFATAELDKNEHQHAFVIVHHLHWWKADAFWWISAHPRFVGKRVRAVIGGDYGPTKYSYRSVDDISYVHAAIAAEPALEMLRMNEQARLLNQQLDGHLYFRVRGDAVDFELRTVGLEDGKHDPRRYDEVNELAPLDYVYYSVWATTRRRWLLAMGLLGSGFAAGCGTVLAAAWLLSRRRRRAT